MEEHRKGVAMLPFNKEASADVSHRADQPSKQKNPGALPLWGRRCTGLPDPVRLEEEVRPKRVILEFKISGSLFY